MKMHLLAARPVVDYLKRLSATAPEFLKSRLDFRAKLYEAIIASPGRAKLLWPLAGLESHPQAGALLAATPLVEQMSTALDTLPVAASVECAGVAHVEIRGELCFRNFEGILASIRAASEVHLRISSPGGDGMIVFDFRDALGTRPSTVLIDGILYSSGLSLAQCFQHRRITAGSTVMVHSPRRWIFGRPADLRSAADALEHDIGRVRELYSRATAQVHEWLQADGETFLNAEEAVAEGLADEVIAPLPVPVHPALASAPAVDRAKEDDGLAALTADLLLRLEARAKDVPQFRADLARILGLANPK